MARRRSLACGVLGPRARDKDYKLAQTIEATVLVLTGVCFGSGMPCGVVGGRDQRSRRAALAEMSPRDASGLLHLMTGCGRLRGCRWMDQRGRIGRASCRERVYGLV